MKFQIALVVVALLASSCGIQKATEDTLEEVRKSNANQKRLVDLSEQLAELTKEVKKLTERTADGLDRSNEKQDQLVRLTTQLAELTAQVKVLTERTATSVDTSNAKQAELIELSKELARLTRDLQSRTTNVEELTRQVRALSERIANGIDVTNAAVHLQVLNDAKKGLESVDTLTPPTMMLVPATVIGREATTVEVAQIFQTYMVDAIMGNLTPKPNPTPEDVRVWQRQVHYMAAKAIAAMAPAAKADAILAGGADDVAIQFAVGRYTFTRDFLFQSVLGMRKIDIKALRRAVEYYTAMKKVASLPYQAQLTVTIPQVKIVRDNDGKPTGEIEDLTEDVKAGEIQQLARQASTRFKTAALWVDPKELETPEAKGLIDQLK